MGRDFRNKTFQKVLRGYSPDEVDEYIAYISDEYHRLEKKSSDTERKLAIALRKLDEISKLHEINLDKTSAAPVESANNNIQVPDEVQLKADEIISNAQKKADEIIKSAEERAAAIAQNIISDAEAKSAIADENTKNAYASAKSLYDEVSKFSKSIYEIYNAHLASVDSIVEKSKGYASDIESEYSGDQTTDEEITTVTAADNEEYTVDNIENNTEDTQSNNNDDIESEKSSDESSSEIISEEVIPDFAAGSIFAKIVNAAQENTTEDEDFTAEPETQVVDDSYEEKQDNAENDTEITVETYESEEVIEDAASENQADSVASESDAAESDDDFENSEEEFNDFIDFVFGDDSQTIGDLIRSNRQKIADDEDFSNDGENITDDNHQADDHHEDQSLENNDDDNVPESESSDSDSDSNMSYGEDGLSFTDEFNRVFGDAEKDIAEIEKQPIHKSSEPSKKRNKI